MAERFRPLAKAGLAALALVLAGCGDTLESFAGPTMGSTYSIKYVRGASAPDVQTAKAAVEAILAEVDRQMSTYRDDSLVSRFNALPAQSCMELPPPMLELLQYGGELSEQSQGAFDMTVEPLMNLWGFGPQARVEKVPSAEQIAARAVTSAIDTCASTASACARTPPYNWTSTASPLAIRWTR